MFETLGEIGIILSITSVVTYYLSLLYGDNFCIYQKYLAGSYAKPGFEEFISVIFLGPLMLGVVFFLGVLFSFVLTPIFLLTILLHIAYKKFEVCRNK